MMPFRVVEGVKAMPILRAGRLLVDDGSLLLKRRHSRQSRLLINPRESALNSYQPMKNWPRRYWRICVEWLAV